MTNPRRFDGVELRFFDPTSPARSMACFLTDTPADREFALYVEQYIRAKNRQRLIASRNDPPTFGPI